MRYNNIITALLFLSFTLSCNAQKNDLFNVKDYGAKGDGITDDYKAISTVELLVNKKGKGEVYFPKGNYFIQPYSTAENKVKDIIFENINGLKITGNEAKITVNGNFVRSKDYSTKKFNFSKTNAVIPFKIVNSTNVEIRNLEIDGQVNKMEKTDNVAESGRYALVLILGSSNVLLKDLYVHHAQTDGILISYWEEIPSQNVTVTNVISSNNARQGMSVTGLLTGHISNSQFLNTGFTGGNYGYHAPGAGVDVEPLNKRKVKDIIFDNCIFEGNRGSQFVLSGPNTTSNVTVKNSTLRMTQGKYQFQIISSGTNILFENNTIDVGSGSIYPMWNKKPGGSVIFRNNKIKGKGKLVVAVPNKSYNKSKEKSLVEFTGNEFFDNGVSNNKSRLIWMSVDDAIFKSNKIILPKGKSTTSKILIQKSKNISDNQLIDSKNKAKVLQLQ